MAKKESLGVVCLPQDVITDLEGYFMAVVKRDANIFKVLKTIHDAWASIENYDTSCFCDEEIESWHAAQRRFVFDGADVRQSFLTEFEEFLFSCKWTDSDVAKEIVGYIQNGTPLNQIGDIVGLKNSAFRMRISRMTDTINGLLFDGQPCPEGVYSLTDLAALKKCLVKLRLVRDPVNINEEFSLRQLGWLKSHIGQADSFDVGRENFDKYLQSVLYLALTSRSFTLNLLGDIDPETLGYAYNDMQSDEVNSTKLIFRLLLRRLNSTSVACKDELSMVKREYQDYMRK